MGQAIGIKDEVPTRVQARRSRRRRWPWILVAIGALLAGGAVAASRFLSEEGVFASAETVALPPLPQDTSPSVAYLRGREGSRVTRFVAAVAPAMSSKADVAACKSAVTALDSIGSPDEIFAAAAGVPDPPTAEMAVGHVAAMSRYLGRCLETGAPPPGDEAHFTAIVLERRLKDLG